MAKSFTKQMTRLIARRQAHVPTSHEKQGAASLANQRLQVAWLHESPHGIERDPFEAPVKYHSDGLLEGDVYTDGTGQRLYGVHDRAACAGRPCVIHDPSDHKLRSFPTHFRFDRYLMERICPHGFGHPDPDDLAFHVSVGDAHQSIHGCDGCCS